jgi:peptide deformylase
MRETLEKAGGYGCAAVHVGILRRVVLINDKSGVIELINPVITSENAQTQDVLEGSIAPGAPRGNVKRPKDVTVSAYNRYGSAITINGSGFLAATLCHEIDHLNGILFTDKAAEVI